MFFSLIERLDQIEDVDGFLTLALPLQAHRQIHADLEEGRLVGGIREGCRARVSAWQLHDPLVRLFVVLHSCLNIVPLLMYQPNIEIGL